MVFIIRIGLLVCLLIISKSFISKQIAKNMKKQIYNSKNENKYTFMTKNAYILRSIYSILVAFIAVVAGNSLIKSLICGFVTYFLIVAFEIIKRNSKKKEVLQDLLNVVECLRVQISSNISLSIALRNIPELCKNKEFSTELTNLYLEYELSKFTVSNSAKELERRFNYPEIKMFISAINQQSQNTSALEAFDNLIEILKEKYVEYMEETTRTKSLIMIFGVCIVVFNLAAMSIYPIIIEASEALEVMLL